MKKKNQTWYIANVSDTFSACRMHERSEKLLLARRSFNAHSPSACRNSYEAGTPEFFLSSSSSSAMRNANWSKGLVKGDIEAIRDDYYFKCTLNPGKCQAKFRFEHVLKKHMVNDSNIFHFAFLAQPHAVAQNKSTGRKM